VRPGISGWAAINQGNVAELDAAATKLRYDFFYIKNISLPLDIYIACKTIKIIITGFGSK
jgi:lipopolysaccharide/colanic/teichoic acid biosynthesis glycosyltransferase